MNTIACYPYRKANSIIKKDGGILKAIHIYTFKNRKNTVYIVNIEEYINDIFIIKYHTKAHRLSKKRYNLLTNEKDARRVIFSCIQIGKDILGQNKIASFGFIGSPLDNEFERKSKYYKTKRFNVYQKFAVFFFSPDNFEHRPNENFSSYLLLNKKKIANNNNYHNEVIEMFAGYYNLQELFTR